MATLDWKQTNERCHYAQDGCGGTFWIERKPDSADEKLPANVFKYELTYDHFELEYPDVKGVKDTLEEAQALAQEIASG